MGAWPNRVIVCLSPCRERDSHFTGWAKMVDDHEALDRACQAIRRYVEHRITGGEALDDLIDVIEKSGRPVIAPERRSFAVEDA